MASPPNRAEIELRSRSRTKRRDDRLHALSRAAARRGARRRGDVLQGPDPDRAHARSRSACAIGWRRWARWPRIWPTRSATLWRRSRSRARCCKPPARAGRGARRRAPLELLDKIVAEVRRLERTVTSSLEFVRPRVVSTLAAASLRCGARRRDHGGHRSAAAARRSTSCGVTSRRSRAFRMDAASVCARCSRTSCSMRSRRSTARESSSCRPRCAPRRARRAFRTPDRAESERDLAELRPIRVVRVSDTGPGIRETRTRTAVLSRSSPRRSKARASAWPWPRRSSTASVGSSTSTTAPGRGARVHRAPPDGAANRRRRSR